MKDLSPIQRACATFVMVPFAAGLCVAFGVAFGVVLIVLWPVVPFIAYWQKDDTGVSP